MNTDFLSALTDLVKDKGIKKEVILSAIRESLLQACKYHFKNGENFRVDMDEETGISSIFVEKTVVEEVHDPATEISLENAKAIDLMLQVGDIASIKVDSQELSRIAAQNASGIIKQKLREEENRALFEFYQAKEHDIITGTIARKVERRPDDFRKGRGGEKNDHPGYNVFVNLDKAEAMLPPQEQIPGENYRVNSRMIFYVTEVRETARGPKISLSRSIPELVKRLFEKEVAELADGTVVIKAISRDPGSRTKMAVYSYDDKVEAVGACVGRNSQRVNAVVDQLGNEKIDIIRWEENDALLIENALSPAKVICVAADEESKSAYVVVPDDQLSLAIGRGGQNAKLAAKLTGYRIDIKSESKAIEEGFFDDVEFAGEEGYEGSYELLDEEAYSNDYDDVYEGEATEYSADASGDEQAENPEE